MSVEVLDKDGEELELMDTEEDFEVPNVGIESPNARKVRERIAELGKNISESFFELSTLVDQVHKDKLYKQWGYKKFADWAQTEFQMGRRKAYNLRQISEYFNTTLKGQLVPAKYEEVVDTVKDIGWSKALELATENVFTNDNCAEVLEAAKTSTVEDLREKCRHEFKAQMTPEELEKSNDNNTMKQMRKTFQLHLGQDEVVAAAIEKAKTMMKDGTTDSSALTNICAEFDAANDASMVMEDKIALMEQVWNLKIVAFDVNKNQVVYGLENLELIAGDC